MQLIDIQVDRLVGPTHHFGGLGVGNIASAQHAGQVSNPQAAALQGLDKMSRVANLGLPQIILPPQQRPKLSFLKAIGFAGDWPDLIRHAYQQDPTLLSAAMSCSATWTANAATVSAAADGRDGSLTITIANLDGSLHRAIERTETTSDLQRVFSRVAQIRQAIPGGASMRDEGAANHMRLGTPENQAGIHLFIHGDGLPAPTTYWPRQTLAASQAVARTLAIDPANMFFLKQNARAIDAGAFHNDVVAASHEGLLLHHELAFENADAQLELIADRYRSLYGKDLTRVEVSAGELSLQDAVRTYLFNSQIVSTKDRTSPPILIAPSQVESHPAALEIVERWSAEGLFSQVQYVDLRQSMAGGGGPACLRLRVPIVEDQLDQIPQQMFWSESLDAALRGLIEKSYPSRVTLADLADAKFVSAAQRAESLVRAKILGDNQAVVDDLQL